MDEQTRAGPPKEPMTLKFASLYSNDEANKLQVMVKWMSSHDVPVCACDDAICQYFLWHWRHFNSCHARPCVSCDRLKRWVQAHCQSCHSESCQLPQCIETKNKRVRSVVSRNHEGFECFSPSHHHYTDSNNSQIPARQPMDYAATLEDIKDLLLPQAPPPLPSSLPTSSQPPPHHSHPPHPHTPHTPHHPHHLPYSDASQIQKQYSALPPHHPHHPHQSPSTPSPVPGPPSSTAGGYANSGGFSSYGPPTSANPTNQNRDGSATLDSREIYARQKSDSFSTTHRSAPLSLEPIAQGVTSSRFFSRNTSVSSVDNGSITPLVSRAVYCDEVEVTQSLPKKRPLTRMEQIPDSDGEEDGRSEEVQDNRTTEEKRHPPLQRLDTDPSSDKMMLDTSFKKEEFDRLKGQRNALSRYDRYASEGKLEYSSSYQSSSRYDRDKPHSVFEKNSQRVISLRRSLREGRNQQRESSSDSETFHDSRGNSPSGFTSPNTAASSSSSGFCEHVLTTSPSDSGGEENFTSLQSDTYEQSAERETSTSTLVESSSYQQSLVSVSHQSTIPTQQQLQLPVIPPTPSSLNTERTQNRPVQRSRQKELLDAALIEQKPSLDFEKKDLEAPAMHKPKDGIRIDLGIDYVHPNWFRPSPHYPAMEQGLYEGFIGEGFSEDPHKCRETYDHRVHVREHLQEQFLQRRVYREGQHWLRNWELGRGAQAACFNIKDFSTGSSLVLKEMKENRHALDEAYVCLKLLKHSFTSPNVVEYFGAARLPRPDGILLQLFLELMPTCMQGYLYSMGPLPPETVRHYAVQLFEGLDHLHNTLGIIHCDIKPGNVLVDETAQRVKIADFGSAELLEESQLGACFCSAGPHGTDSYNPPELHRDQCCGYALDVWQAGQTVLAMASGRRPWRHCYMDVHPEYKKHALAKVCRGRSREKIIAHYGRPGSYPLPQFLDSDTRKVLHGCLQFQHTSRIPAQDCAYLLAMADATCDEQRQKVLDVYQYGRNPEVLRSPSAYQRPMVDVYLASRHTAEILSLTHVLEGGWLASIPWEHSLTYGDLCDLKREFPVLANIGAYSLSVCDNCPQAIWKSVKGHVGGASFSPVLSYSAVVDHSRAVIISAPSSSCDQ